MTLSTRTIDRPERDRPIPLTPQGRLWIEQRIARLVDETLPGLVRDMEQAGEDDRLRHEHARALALTEELSAVLDRAVPASTGRRLEGPITLGDEVELRLGPGRTERYQPVHPAEAPLDDVRISFDSPLARAILGHGPGEVVEVTAPDGAYRCRLIRWEDSPRRLIAEVVPDPDRGGERN